MGCTFLRQTLVCLGLSLASSQVYAAGPSLEGVFVGQLHLVDRTVRDIPFQLSMSLSEEVEVIDTVNGPEQRRIIDAAFMVDGEGGPYTFTKVSYDLDLNVLDLRYSRNLSDNVPGTRAPASFRLTGKINDDGSLEGRVVSGFYGNIGTFKLAKSNVGFLQAIDKYKGLWTAQPSWHNQTFWVNLEPTSTNIKNPPGHELDFTPGKVGGIHIGEFVEVGFNNVSIDYIHQTLVLAATDPVNGPNLSMDCKIVPKTLDLDCQFDSVYGGRKGPVYLRKVR